jgi:hypothetical protein
MGLSGRGLLVAVMCLSGRLLVAGSYVPFRYVVGGRHLCPSGWGLVVGCYVPFW